MSNVSTLQQLATNLASRIVPKLVDGKWRKAEISAKRLAKIQKDAHAAGVELNLPEKERKPMRLKPNKGHKHDRLKPERLYHVIILWFRVLIADNSIGKPRLKVCLSCNRR